MCTTYNGECATDELLLQYSSRSNAIFAQKSISLIQNHLAMLKFQWLCNHRIRYDTIHVHVMRYSVDHDHLNIDVCNWSGSFAYSGKNI